MRRRGDRNLLISLQEQGNQIDNIAVGHFNMDTKLKSQDELRGSEAEREAAQWMQQNIAEPYAAAQLEVKDLKKERERLLKIYKAEGRKKATPEMLAEADGRASTYIMKKEEDGKNRIWKTSRSP